MSAADAVRDALSTLRIRLARGEIDEATYDRLRRTLLEGLSPAEMSALGLAPGSVPSSEPARLGPTGGRGEAVETRVASRSELSLEPGRVLFGQWRVVRELGRGGFGVVVEAEELTLRERQALKVLDPSMLAEPRLLERFRREVKSVRSLRHPRIVRLFDYRESLPEGVALFSMELVGGCSVQQLLVAARGRSARVSVRLALTIVAQLLEALEAAHSQGVLHRDVTPANVLLAGGSPEELLGSDRVDPKVKLTDFGIAGALEGSERSQRSRALGTAAYAAPEVLDPRAEVTAAADLYGAGAVLYELLTGEAPLGRFEDPAALRPDVGAQVNALVVALLERQPSRRPHIEAARHSLRLAIAGPAVAQPGRIPPTMASLQVVQPEARTIAKPQAPPPVVEPPPPAQAGPPSEAKAVGAGAEGRAPDVRPPAPVPVPQAPVPEPPNPPGLLGDPDAAPSRGRAVARLLAIGAVLVGAVLILGRLELWKASRPADVAKVSGRVGEAPSAPAPLAAAPASPASPRRMGPLNWSVARSEEPNEGRTYRLSLTEARAFLGREPLAAFHSSNVVRWVPVGELPMAEQNVDFYRIPVAGGKPFLFVNAATASDEQHGRAAYTFLRAEGVSFEQYDEATRYDLYLGVFHVGDLDGDGFPELVVGERAEGPVHFDIFRFEGTQRRRIPVDRMFDRVWIAGDDVAFEAADGVYIQEGAQCSIDWPEIYQWDGSTFADVSSRNTGFYSRVYLPRLRADAARYAAEPGMTEKDRSDCAAEMAKAIRRAEAFAEKGR